MTVSTQAPPVPAVSVPVASPTTTTASPARRRYPTQFRPCRPKETPMTDQPFKPGDRVYVTDPGLAQLRAIMRNATGQEPAPNHHGTVEEVWDSGRILIHFDDGCGAPYPADEVRHLTAEEADR